MDGRAWWAAVHGVARSRTRLSDFTSTFHFLALEKEMATHSSVLAWRMPGTGEPGGLPSMGSHRVGHDWSDLAGDALRVPDPSYFMFPFAWRMSKFLSQPLWPLVIIRLISYPLTCRLCSSHTEPLSRPEELVMIWPLAYLTPHALNTRSCLIQPLI